MSLSPNSLLLHRTIDLNYAQKQRSNSMKWIAVNAVFFTLFAFDLWGKCAGYRSALHYVELACAAVLAANVGQHALRLVRLLLAARAARPLPLTPHQRRLLGLANSSLDSSFCEVSPEPSPGAAGAGAGAGSEREEEAAEEALSLSMSASLAAARAWRSSPSPARSPPPSPPSPATPGSPGSPASAHSSPRSPRYDRDEFISDSRALSAYLRRRAERSRDESWGGEADGECAGRGGGAWPAPGSAPSPPPPTYQLAALDAEGSPEEGGGGGGAGGGGGGAGGAPQHVWRRLQLDPRRLTEYNLNLRLWLQVTILERLVREMDAHDAAFAAHGLQDVRIGQVSTERLRKMAAAGMPGLTSLLPFLEPFPDQRYVVQRYRELAAGGCLSAYKWNGGGAEWAGGGGGARPADPELVLHALAAYMDAQLPAAGAWFSGAHVSAAPAPPPRAPRALALHRLARAPPHYVLVRGEEMIEVGAGRNNLLHTLLLFLAAAAGADPPALRRLHLGPAGLNMLWIIGR